MRDRDARRLMELLAKYATDYGRDCDADITVKCLADDLAESNSDPSLTYQMETLRDEVYDGLNAAR